MGQGVTWYHQRGDQARPVSKPMLIYTHGQQSSAPSPWLSLQLFKAWFSPRMFRVCPLDATFKPQNCSSSLSLQNRPPEELKDSKFINFYGIRVVLLQRAPRNLDTNTLKMQHLLLHAQSGHPGGVGFFFWSLQCQPMS